MKNLYCSNNNAITEKIEEMTLAIKSNLYKTIFWKISEYTGGIYKWFVPKLHKFFTST